MSGYRMCKGAAELLTNLCSVLKREIEGVIETNPSFNANKTRSAYVVSNKNSSRA